LAQNFSQIPKQNHNLNLPLAAWLEAVVAVAVVVVTSGGGTLVVKTTVLAEAVVIDCEEVAGVVDADGGVVVVVGADGSIDFG
jgi:hypothetical protein